MRATSSVPRWRRRLAAIAWRYPTADEVACRRAGGRRDFNARRRLAREARRARLADLVAVTWPRFLGRGWQSWAARQFDVDRATVCRDVDAILSDISPPGLVLSHGVLRALAEPLPG